MASCDNGNECAMLMPSCKTLGVERSKQKEATMEIAGTGLK